MRMNGTALAVAVVCGALLAGCSKGSSKGDGGDYWFATREDGMVTFINRPATSNLPEGIKRTWILSVFDPYRRLAIVTHRMELVEFKCAEGSRRVTNTTMYYDDSFKYSVDSSYEKFIRDHPGSTGMIMLKLVCGKAAYVGKSGQTSDAAIASTDKLFKREH